MESVATSVLRCIGCETEYEERPDAPVACPACGATGWIAVWARREDRPEPY